MYMHKKGLRGKLKKEEAETMRQELQESWASFLALTVLPAFLSLFTVGFGIPPTFVWNMIQMSAVL